MVLELCLSEYITVWLVRYGAGAMSLRIHYSLVGEDMVQELCLSEYITVWLGKIIMVQELCLSEYITVWLSKIWCWSYVTQITLQSGWGEHLHSLELSICPHRLAVIGSGPGNTWNVAVTFLTDQRIAVLKVTSSFVVQLFVYGDVDSFPAHPSHLSVSTIRKYHAIATADAATLAVGCSGWIDMIHMAGRVLGRVSEPLDPWYMTVTQDRCLFMSTRDDTVAKVRIKEGRIIFNKAGLNVCVVRMHKECVCVDIIEVCG
ncbi:hypothetical protein RRG08_059629 [Elysia crispata]|uniref:Uncharacterized protein n=1 Tax=Elysia crispata TaxID=231223 RepID=A0AAE0YKD3_9GAST|nr:hypothetical protein RRG08_059629 [Elysia crispata]